MLREREFRIEDNAEVASRRDGMNEILLGIDRTMLLTLESWERFPIRRNSVLEGFREREI